MAVAFASPDNLAQSHFVPAGAGGAWQMDIC